MDLAESRVKQLEEPKYQSGTVPVMQLQHKSGQNNTINRHVVW